MEENNLKNKIGGEDDKFWSLKTTHQCTENFLNFDVRVVLAAKVITDLVSNVQKYVACQPHSKPRVNPTLGKAECHMLGVGTWHATCLNYYISMPCC